MEQTRVKSRFQSFLAEIHGTAVCTVALILGDVVFCGSYLGSLFVCPIWFLAAVVSALVYKPSLGVGAARVLMPPAVLLLAVVNSSLQNSIAMDHAEQVIQACNEYHDANGVYPKRLNDLAPRYLSSIPRAKYCLAFGELRYHASEEDEIHSLVWCELPPFGRRIYNFERGTWGYLD